jgi:hypothetical protein
VSFAAKVVFGRGRESSWKRQLLRQVKHSHVVMKKVPSPCQRRHLDGSDYYENGETRKKVYEKFFSLFRAQRKLFIFQPQHITFTRALSQNVEK